MWKVKTLDEDVCDIKIEKFKPSQKACCAFQ